MKLTIEKKHQQEVTLTPPLFWKENTSFCPDYVALLDDETAVKVYDSGTMVIIQHGTPDNMKSTILKAYSDYHPCDETEFFRVYNEAHYNTRLMPVEKTTQNIYSENL